MKMCVHTKALTSATRLLPAMGIVLAISFCCAAQQEQPPGEPTPASGVTSLVAGHGDMLWVIRIDPTGNFELLFRTEKTPADSLHRGFKSTGEPIAVAAFDRTLYCVYRDRSVQAIRRRSPDEGLSNPFDTQQLPPLPRSGALAGFVAGRSGPAALIIGAADEPAEKQEPSSDAPSQSGPLRLLRLRMGKWEPISLSQQIIDTRTPASLRLVMIDGAADRLALLNSADQVGTLAVHEFDGQNWNAQAYDFTLARQAQALGLQHSLFIVQPARAQSPDLEVYLLRDAKVRALGAIGAYAGASHWWAVAGDEQIVVVAVDERDRLAWAQRAISDAEGAPAELKPLEVTDPPPVRTDPVSMVVIAAVAVAMLFMLGGPRRGRQAKLQKGARLAGVDRIFAAIVDIIPAFAAGMIVFKIANPADVFTEWFRPPTDWPDMFPGLTVIGVHVLHTLLGELISGATLGKLLFGCRVVTLDGKRPSPTQILVRNLFKAIELIPPGALVLLLMPLLNANQQRLGDLVAGTLVVVQGDAAQSTREESKEPGDSDESDESK